jgi:CRP/FNR family transcriptional regulator, cyclic AMP receptor protein
MNDKPMAPAGGFRFVARNRGRAANVSAPARSPYGLEIIENCVTCPHREARLFCNLSPAPLQRLAEITSSATYPKGASLFVEGQPARGVFILCAGHVKLSTSSADGRTLILRIAEPGDLLGLPATISDHPYEVTADVIEPTQANFIGRADFLNFLREFGEVAVRVAQELSVTYQSALAEMRTIGLSHSAREKLARFVLDWSAQHPSENGAVRFNLTLTHEEIAQMIGASRETVTRLFADFKKKNLLQIRGSSVTIRDKRGLEQLLEAV